ncbi:MAG TPA: DUF502 domain-containing protein, partial [Algoriphagus sp.]|nr:DUF502 domain-containing protein [Algoriphagus sp.]
LFNIVSQTVKGGIFFLLPIVIIVLLFAKALSTVKPVAETIREQVHLEFPFLALIISLMILLLICYLAGWVAGKGMGKAMINWLENNLLDLFPGYQLMKSTMETKVGNISEKEFPVVLVPGDGWQIGFQVEVLPNEEVVVFIPSAPNVWEGSLAIFEKAQLRATKLKQADVMALMKKLGVGTAELLKAGINN